MEYYEKCKRQKREDISYCQFYNDSNCKKTCNYSQILNSNKQIIDKLPNKINSNSNLEEIIKDN